MSITVICRQCGASYVVPASFAASKGECQKCGAILLIPELRGSQQESARPSAAAQPDASLEVTEEASLLELPAAAAATSGTIRFHCDGCGKPLQVKARYAGWPTRCDACGKVVNVPGQRAGSTASPNTGDRDGPTFAGDVDPTPEPKAVTDHLDQWSNDPLELATSRSSAGDSRVLPRRRGKFLPRALRGIGFSVGPLGTLLDYLGQTLARIITPKLGVSALAGLLVFAVVAANWERFVSITHLDELFAVSELTDAVRILERLARLEEEMLDLDRGITDVPSAHRAAQRRAEITVAMQALVTQFVKLPANDVDEKQRAAIERLTEQGEKRYRRVRIEAGRLQRIPGVTDALAAPMRRRGLRGEPFAPLRRADLSRLLSARAAKTDGDRPLPTPSFRNDEAREAFTGRRNPSATPDERLSFALDDLGTSDVRAHRRALSELADLAAVEERRDELTRAVQPFLADDDASTQRAALEALMVWKTEQTATILIDLLKTAPRAIERELVMAMATLQDERCAEAVAELLPQPDDRAGAVDALRKMGPFAEEAVLRYLFHSELLVRERACQILETIGTKRSLVDLSRLRRSRTRPTRAAANRAIEAIRSRENGTSEAKNRAG